MIEAQAKIPQEWRPAERYVAVCGRCGAEILKRNAAAIYCLRHGQTMRVLMHLCPRCYAMFLDDYGIGE